MPESYWKIFKQPDPPEPYTARLVEEFLPKDIEYEIKGFYQGTYQMFFVGSSAEVRRLEIDNDDAFKKVLSWSVFDKDRNLIHKEVLHNES